MRIVHANEKILFFFFTKKLKTASGKYRINMVMWSFAVFRKRNSKFLFYRQSCNVIKSNIVDD